MTDQTYTAIADETRVAVATEIGRCRAEARHQSGGAVDSDGRPLYDEHTWAPSRWDVESICDALGVDVETVQRIWSECRRGRRRPE